MRYCALEAAQPQASLPKGSGEQSNRKADHESVGEIEQKPCGDRQHEKRLRSRPVASDERLHIGDGIRRSPETESTMTRRENSGVVVAAHRSKRTGVPTK